MTHVRKGGGKEKTELIMNGEKEGRWGAQRVEACLTQTIERVLFAKKNTREFPGTKKKGQQDVARGQTRSQESATSLRRKSKN